MVDTKKKGGEQKKDNEGQKVKKMYEDMMEQQRKQFEVQIKNIRSSTAEEIEALTSLFSKSSRDLVNLTIEHRALQKKFSDYIEKSDVYIKDLEGKLEHEKSEVVRLKDAYENFDQRFKAKNEECADLKKKLK